MKRTIIQCDICSNEIETGGCSTYLYTTRDNNKGTKTQILTDLQIRTKYKDFDENFLTIIEIPKDICSAQCIKTFLVEKLSEIVSKSIKGLTNAEDRLMDLADEQNLSEDAAYAQE